MANNLKDHLKEVADAIRAKKGTSNLINPQDFAKEIEGISGSGGGESGGSNVEYLDINGDMGVADILMGGIEEMSITLENAPIPIEGVIGLGTAVIPLVNEFQQVGATVNINAVAYNRDAVTMMKQNGAVITQTAYEGLVSKGEAYVEIYNKLPRLTKEQFYDLNA